MAKQTAPKIDTYQQVTDRIVAQLEGGVRPWQKPWTVEGGMNAKPLRANGKPYRGINVWLLWGEAVSRGYTSPFWLTYNQAKADGGSVKKGEKGTFVVYASSFEKDSKDKPGEKEKIFVMKHYYVFNADQCENLPPRYHPKAPEVTEASKAERITHAEAYFAKVGASVKHGGDRAFYNSAADYIQLPAFEAFKDAESYYATSGHEHIHWTGHKDRMAREFGKRFGDEAYAAEELVAELGAAFLCAELGLALEPRDDHAAYISHWLKILKGDKRFIVQAASAAQKAMDHLNELAGEDQEAADAEEAGELAEAA